MEVPHQNDLFMLNFDATYQNEMTFSTRFHFIKSTNSSYVLTEWYANNVPSIDNTKCFSLLLSISQRLSSQPLQDKIRFGTRS